MLMDNHFKKLQKNFKERAPNIEVVGDELIQPFGKVQDFNPYVTKIKVRSRRNFDR